VSLQPQQAPVVIFVTGELDIANAPTIEATLFGAEAAGAEEIVLDLSRLDFMGSVGLRVILDAVHDEHWMHSLRRWHGEPAVPSLLRVPEDLPALFESPFPPLDANALSDSPGASDENGDHSTERV